MKKRLVFIVLLVLVLSLFLLFLIGDRKMQRIQPYALYSVPQWGMYIMITETVDHKYQVSFSKDREPFFSPEKELDYVVVENPVYNQGMNDYFLVNEHNSDTLFCASANFNSVHIPMDVMLYGRSYHLIRSLGRFKAEAGFFGFYIENENKQIRLKKMEGDDSHWEIVEIDRVML